MIKRKAISKKRYVKRFLLSVLISCAVLSSYVKLFFVLILATTKVRGSDWSLGSNSKKAHQTGIQVLQD